MSYDIVDCMKIHMLLTFIIINVVAFGVMCLDKTLARVGAYRVPEKWLFGLALLGGGIGTFLAMRLVRHKTKHWTFVYGIPLCILLNVLFLYPLVFYSFQEWVQMWLRLLF